MPGDYEDLFDVDNMDDDEVSELILEEMDDYPEIDPEALDIQVEDGFVTLNGRVGTEQEMQLVEHAVSDVLGIANYSNEIVVDENERAQYPDAADDAAVEEEETAASLGDAGDVTDPAADHLMDDVESDMYGTQDLQKAIERGAAYEPPVRPPQEGTWSEENH